MEYDNRTFFKEHEEDDVKGFTVLRVNEDAYHIGEKWLAHNDEDEDVWVQYVIPESQLLRRVEAGECEPVGQLSDEQFDKVVSLVGMDMGAVA